MEQRLKQEPGLKVADIGCGYGITTILMAKADLNCEFYGFDNHAASIEYARNKAREEVVDDDRVRFEVESSTNFPPPTAATEERKKGEDAQRYDLIAFFDCLHDMEDPQGAAAHALKSIKPDGCFDFVLGPGCKEP